MKKTILFINFLNASAPGNEVEIPDARREVVAAPSKKAEESGNEPKSGLDKLMKWNPNCEVAIPNLGIRTNGIGSGTLMIRIIRKPFIDICQERKKLESFEKIRPFLEEVLFAQRKSDDSVEKIQCELLANLLSDKSDPISIRHLERLGVEILLVRINCTCVESTEMFKKYSEANLHTRGATITSYPRDIGDLKEKLMRLFPKTIEDLNPGLSLVTRIGRLISNLNLRNAKLSRKGEAFLKARADLYKKDITQEKDKEDFLKSIPVCIRLAMLENAEERMERRRAAEKSQRADAKTVTQRHVKYKTEPEETEELLPAASAAQPADTPMQENLSGREAFELYFEEKYGINFTNLCNSPDMHDYNEKMRKAREETCVAS